MEWRGIRYGPKPRRHEAPLPRLPGLLVAAEMTEAKGRRAMK